MYCGDMQAPGPPRGDLLANHIYFYQLPKKLFSLEELFDECTVKKKIGRYHRSRFFTCFLLAFLVSTCSLHGNSRIEDRETRGKSWGHRIRNPGCTGRRTSRRGRTPCSGIGRSGCRDLALSHKPCHRCRSEGEPTPSHCARDKPLVTAPALARKPARRRELRSR